MITLPTKPLKSALPLLTHRYSGAPLPVLDCVRVTTHTFGTRTTITATDLDTTVARTFDHDRQPLGDFLLFKADLAALVRASKDPAVRLVPITAPPDLKQWPEKQFNFTTHASLPLDTALVRKAMLASSTDSTHYVINGVAIEGDNLIGTDGRRLLQARSSFDFSAWNNENSAAFILRNDKIVQKWLAHAPDLVNASLENGRNVLRLSAGDGSYTLTTKLIEGNFPNWKQVVRDKHLLNITMNADDLRQAIARLPVLDSEALVFTFRHGVTTVAVNGGNGNVFFAPVASAFDCDRKPAVIQLDRNYVLDACTAGFTRIAYMDEISPVHFESPAITYVLMPMRGNIPATGFSNDPYTKHHTQLQQAA